MSEQVLDGPDVDSAFEEMGCERMAKSVGCGALGQTRARHGLLELTLHGVFMEVVPGHPACAGVRAEGGGCEDMLPGPLAGGVGVFAQEALGQVDIPGPHGQVALVLFPGVGQVAEKDRFESPGQGDNAVFGAFSVMDGDGSLSEIDVLDAQAQCFHQAQS